MIKAWVLTFHVLAGSSFVGGEYVTEQRCRAAAAMQMPQWRKTHGWHLTWTCRLDR